MARPAVISTGTMTAAERLAPVTMFARSSIPAVPRPNGRVSERSRNGESSAVPPIRSMTISAAVRGSVAADLKNRATAASAAIPQQTATRPASSRNRPIRLGSTAASRSASVGLIVPARKAATSTDSTATATPARKATTRASAEPAVKFTLNQDGARPWRTIQPARAGAPTRPSREPTAEPATPTSAASAHIVRITCFGVAPMLRSNARSRRRCATESPKAVAVTVMATKAESRAATPRKFVSPVSAVASCEASGSA